MVEFSSSTKLERESRDPVVLIEVVSGMVVIEAEETATAANSLDLKFH
jgi:hypothetical protein